MNLTRSTDNTDFRTTESLSTLGRQLVGQLQQHDAFAHNRLPSSPALRHTLLDCRQWLESVEKTIESIPPGQALNLLSCYDLIHRVTLRSTGRDFINRQFMRAFNARIHGDTSVSETDLMEAIAQGLRMRDPLYFDKPLTWYTLTLEQWTREHRPTQSHPPTILNHV